MITTLAARVEDQVAIDNVATTYIHQDTLLYNSHVISTHRVQLFHHTQSGIQTKAVIDVNGRTRLLRLDLKIDRQECQSHAYKEI